MKRTVHLHPMGALQRRPREIEPLDWWEMEWWRARLADLKSGNVSEKRTGFRT